MTSAADAFDAAEPKLEGCMGHVPLWGTFLVDAGVCNFGCSFVFLSRLLLIETRLDTNIQSALAYRVDGIYWNWKSRTTPHVVTIGLLRGTMTMMCCHTSHVWRSVVLGDIRVFSVYRAYK